MIWNITLILISCYIAIECYLSISKYVNNNYVYFSSSQSFKLTQISNTDILFPTVM